jgi:TPR repeat protein
MKKFLLVLIAALPFCQAAHAQKAADALVSLEAASQRHRTGLALEHRGDEKGAFIAYREAAEQGFPPAQRKLGEIYDSGNAAVERNYPESIRWYQKAREGGEIIPPPPSPMPALAPKP